MVNTRGREACQRIVRACPGSSRRALITKARHMPRGASTTCRDGNTRNEDAPDRQYREQT